MPAAGKVFSSGHHSRHSRLEWPFDGSERPDVPVLSEQDILLAFDGSAEAAAATRVTDAIARQLPARVQVVSVIDTSPVPIPFPLDLVIRLGAERAGSTIHQQQEREIRNQISAVLSHPTDWPTSIELGVPAAAIVRHASRTKAALVVMGLRRHGLVDRTINDETALSVMRKTAGPVLGVVADTTGLPERALVAMDFTRASIHAAVAAARLMTAGGSMTLAYVESLMEDPPGSSDAVIHALGLAAAFERLGHALARDDLRVDHVILHHSKPGSPSRILLEYAEGRRVDLLVAGSGRHGRLDRILLGSVSAELVRAGQYSTLVVPPDTGELLPVVATAGTSP
jgi:nucleotide-binding universal stress UspA family protein